MLTCWTSQLPSNKNKFLKVYPCIICLFLLLMDTVRGSGIGSCPKYPSLQKFNMSWLAGEWYEVEKSFYLPEIANGCTTLDLNPLNNFKLEVTIKTINRVTGNPSVSSGYATLESSKSSTMDFKINTRFPDVIARLLPGSGKYQVLYTDYENFVIIWSCGSLGSLAYFDQIWVLGRERDFPAEVRKQIYDALKKLSLKPKRLVLSKNKNCRKTL